MAVQMGDEFGGNALLGLVTGQPLNRFTAFEEHQGGHTHYLVLHCDVSVIVYIQLDYFYFAVPNLRQLLDDGVEHLARRAPNGCKIDQHRGFGLQHFADEISFAYTRKFSHAALQ